MADTKEVKYEITAENSQFIQAMTQSALAVSSVTDQVKKGLGGITDVFEKIQKPLLAMTAVIGGGAYFKEAIAVANKLNGEATKLSKSLGITGEEAATLRTALGDIYSDSDTYIGAFQKFAKQIKTNEDGLQAMGLKTRDSNGNLRDSNELFKEGLAAVGTYKPGLDQTTAAMTLFGKGVDEVMTLQKLNSEVMEDAKKKNKELGMNMTNEGVAATKAYKAAMNDVGDVMEAVKNTVGKAVMPVFTELGKQFAESGPYVVDVFKKALTGLMLVFRGLQAVVKTVSAVVFEMISSVIDQAGNMADVVASILRGDWGGAVDAAKSFGARYTQAWRNIGSATKDAFLDSQKSFGSDVSSIWDEGTEVGKPKGGKKTMGSFDKTNKGGAEKSQMGGFEEALAAQKAAIAAQGLAEGQFREMSKADEAKYWNDIKALRSISQNDRVAASKKASELELGTIKDGLEQKVAVLKAEAAAFKNNVEEKLRIELQIQGMYGQGTKQFAESQARINAIQLQGVEQAKAVAQATIEAKRQASLTMIAMDEQEAQFQYQMGALSYGQLLEAQQQFEQRRYQISHDALVLRLQEAMLDPDKSPAEVARLQGQMEELEGQHQLKMGSIKKAAQVEGMQPIANVFKAAETAMASSIQNMINGTQSLRSAMASIWSSISKTVIGELSKYLAKRVAVWAAEKALTMAGIGSDAAKAGSGAAASQASIPYIGPILAVAAMASIFGAVSGMSSKVPSASAAGGFDIPHSVNPVVQAHAREMILPEKYSDVIRGMAENGGGGGGGDVHNWTIQAVDARGFEDMLMKRGGSDVLIKALKERQRNGGLKL